MISRYDAKLYPSNAWTMFEHAEVYIRIGPRRLNDGSAPVCVQIANMQTPPKYERTGIFTRMVLRIRTITTMPIYLENVKLDLADALVERHGWVHVRRADVLEFFRNDLFGKNLVLTS